jgi:hypothetical protein
VPAANSGALWTDTATNVASATRMYVTQTAPGVYDIVAGGADDAGLVSDGAGGYTITPAAAGTGRLVQIGGAVVVI